ncbi:nudix hydrolase 17, mitochondrial-like [Hibiscus syriacus]|uniref:nudix hydrolase 17, mitochondrial-like n=1 Tax=Hibiscus syriacus TaxID=106335 RepID=UPI001921DB6F|nr:nudix hydrolase 17, mitochondrial-like [Hibiscus syriacus]
MACLVSRTGRDLQRYDNLGRRQVVGCIPYRFKCSNDGTVTDELEVLLISSQKGQKMMFPKGGWELDESREDAALRESVEEAGVIGNVEMNVKEARDVCQHWWMKEALDIFVERLSSLQQ